MDAPLMSVKRINATLQRIYDAEVALSAPQISQGAASHAHLASLLKGKEQSDTTFPWILDSGLSGSYARGTKNYPLDDIDLLITIDGAGLVAYRYGQPVYAEVRGSRWGNPVERLVGPDGMISSKRLMDAFRAGIAASYPNSSIRKDGQAVSVLLSNGLGLDVVPAFHIVPRDGSVEHYYIPEGGDGHGWIFTNPEIDKNLCDALNDYHGGWLKPVIRLVKFWNMTRNADRLKSYHLEVLVWHSLSSNPPIADLRSGLLCFFDRAPELASGSCPDPTGLGAPLDRYLTLDARAQSINALNTARTLLGRARVVEPFAPGPLELSAWGGVFGPVFARMAA